MVGAGRSVSAACTHADTRAVWLWPWRGSADAVQAEEKLRGLVRKGTVQVSSEEDLQQRVDQTLQTFNADMQGVKVCMYVSWPRRGAQAPPTSRPHWAHFDSVLEHATARARGGPVRVPHKRMRVRLARVVRAVAHQGVLVFERRAKDLDRRISSAEQEAGGNKEELEQSLRKV